MKQDFVTRLTRRLPQVEQERLTLLEYLSLPPVFKRVRVTRSVVLCVYFIEHCLSFFFLAIVLSVLRFMDSDYLPLVSSNSSSFYPYISCYYCKYLRNI